MSYYPGPPGPPPWQPGPGWQQPPLPRRRNPWPLLGLVLALVALVVGGGYLIFVKDKADDSGEVLLQPLASDGPYPWTPSVVPAGAPTSVPTSTPVGAPGGTVSGDHTGIYGGSLELSVCDKKKLISFLERNTAQREAWLSVLGVNDVAPYVNSLTQVILAADTRVTNHGFEDNNATPLQSVLQAGTAVLVDERGVPRVRCQCGNPLLEPVLSNSDPTYAGEQWPGFNPDRIIVVQPAATPITQITVINVADGEPLVLPFGDETEPPVTTTRPSSTSRSSTTASPAVRPSEVLGYWTGDWGDMLLTDGGGGVIVGAYAYDDGVLTGTLTGSTFQGRWCEQPRTSGTDQGPVEFTFVEVGGKRQIDGRWKYDSDGAGGQWREDWDLSEQSASNPPADLVQRTKDPSLRCA